MDTVRQCSPQLHAKTNIVPADGAPGLERGSEGEWAGPPPQSPTPAAARSQWCLPSILQLGSSLWPRGPVGPLCTGAELCLLVLTRPPALRRATECYRTWPPVDQPPPIHRFFGVFFCSFSLQSGLQHSGTFFSNWISFKTPERMCACARG